MKFAKMIYNVKIINFVGTQIKNIALIKERLVCLFIVKKKEKHLVGNHLITITPQKKILNKMEDTAKVD
jgi:uncharacterized protein (UPF0262 family)